MPIEDVICPIHKIRMQRTKSQHGAYWRCPKWGCDQKANTMGEIVKPREEKDEEGENFPDGWKPKNRRWEE